MEILIKRSKEDGEATLGELYIDGAFQCYTLEDQRQAVKVDGETRIPATDDADPYNVELRTHGGMHIRYTEKFGWHKGMLEIMDVPGFTDILMHIGNYDAHTAGCILVGEVRGVDDRGILCVWGSKQAYMKMYNKVIEGFNDGGTVSLIVTNKFIEKVQ